MLVNGAKCDFNFDPKYFFYISCAHRYSTFSYTRDRERLGNETLATLQTTVSLIPGLSPDTRVMKEEPLEDDPLKADMLVTIKGDPDKPEMAQPSSAATGTGKRNHLTRSTYVICQIILLSLEFLWGSFQELFSEEYICASESNFLIQEFSDINLNQ